VLRTGSRPALEDPGAGDDDPILSDIETDPGRAPPPVETFSASDEEDTADATPSDPASGGSDDAPPDQLDEEISPVEVVPGIGSAYADRLRGAGVGTVDDLAAADPEQLADRTDIATGRVETWVERARELDRPG
jgi:predicted flap endonuclease-1-like 5' DNA nuclease